MVKFDKIIILQIGFSAIEAVSNLKLMDVGVSKEDITVISMFIDIMQIITPVFVIKLISNTKPMNLYLKILPFK